MKKTRVGVLFGGKSAEHEVSLQSAKNVIEAINKEKYEVVPIGIDKTGTWHLTDRADYLVNANNPKLIALNKSNEQLMITPGEEMSVTTHQRPLEKLDVVFPVLHGSYGEDGSVQGLLRLLDIPCVGAGVLGSAVGLDKDVMKRLLRDAGLPVARFLTFRPVDRPRLTFDNVSAQLGQPFFIKPVNTGSSVGVSKVKSAAEFNSAVEAAFSYDVKAICEQFIEGREIECSILGNDRPAASVPGEIIVKHEFYSYEAKYIDEAGAELNIPADLPTELADRVRALAIEAFKVLNGAGMARVDFFLAPAGKLYINEINTIPGFTKISMYPKLWEASGLSYSDLIDRLITLAIERHQAEKRVQTDYRLSIGAGQ